MARAFYTGEKLEPRAEMQANIDRGWIQTTFEPLNTRVAA